MQKHTYTSYVWREPALGVGPPIMIHVKQTGPLICTDLLHDMMTITNNHLIYTIQRYALPVHVGQYNV